MNRRRLLLFSLLALAAWLALFGNKTPSGGTDVDVVAPMPARTGQASGMTTASQPAVASARSGERAGNLEVAALIPREQLIPGATGAQPGRDLFPSSSWTPAPEPIIATKPPPMAPPMAPPLPFVYLGKKLEQGQWEAYLGRGEEVFIVREGMTLDRIYKVKALSPSTLTLIYLPLKQLQTIAIGGSP